MHLILQERFWVVDIPFVHMVKLQFLAQSPVDQLTHPVMPSLILCVNLVHSHIMGLIVLFLSPHYLHLLFCCVLSFLHLILLVLMVLLCAAIRKDSISFLKFSFLRLTHIFLCEMLLVCLLKYP